MLQNDPDTKQCMHINMEMNSKFDINDEELIREIISKSIFS